MSLILQIAMVLALLAFLIKVMKDVKKGKLRSDYALGWILVICAMLILAIAPQIVFFFSGILKIISSVNMVFAIIIFLLIILVYTLMCRVSSLEEKQKNIIQELALKNKREE